MHSFKLKNKNHSFKVIDTKATKNKGNPLTLGKILSQPPNKRNILSFMEESLDPPDFDSYNDYKNNLLEEIKSLKEQNKPSQAEEAKKVFKIADSINMLCLICELAFREYQTKAMNGRKIFYLSYDTYLLKYLS